MASTDPWFDFEQIRHNIKNNTVDKLKHILSGLNEECFAHLSKTGKKQDIIDRIVHALDDWRRQNNADKWTKAKAVVTQVRSNGVYSRHLPPMATLNTTTFANQGIAKASFSPSHAGPSSLPRYDPYAPPRRPGPLPTPSTPTHKAPEIRFKESPFYGIEQTVSQVIECPESTSSSDRRQGVVQFTLTTDHISKLKAPGSRYQLRLFCTSSIFYSPSSTFRATNNPCLIEFPPTCEVRVNNVQIPANLKGMKKKPGTAPPPDIGKFARISNMMNRVEMVYVNSQQPAPAKKYYLVVMLVKFTTVEELVTNLKASGYRSRESILQTYTDSQNDDDEIIAGPQKMSLKCPLSFMPIVTPSRSSKCVHAQCFDATSWLAVNEQTTTWLCPVCERVLEHKDLIIDGYFDEILKSCPESVEDVMVEADGQWHTSDNRHGSASWLAQHPPIHFDLPQTPEERKPSPSGDDKEEKQKPADIVVLDSDDEEEGRVKRELSPSIASAPPSSTNTQVADTGPTRANTSTEDVIDLTLDSDNEEPPPPKPTGKRKAAEAGMSSASPTEAIWKKGRHDVDQSAHSTLGTSKSSSQPPNPRNVSSSYNPYSGTLPPIHLGFGPPRDLESQTRSSHAGLYRINNGSSRLG
ncbi:hypothetical protein BDN72DRAFT_807638 [Pluteus cervinus]|uniref:Uncharacterized protein n=1 Tax=Pluteus cervinus TaxID=181527 RepID=A0ACD3BGZ2_9AGAR|nr:hypothetical protein BDN72DRAFT_807638 [Pluteus cervinus]